MVMEGTKDLAVFCLHSSASSSRQFEALASFLGDRYQVIAPDLQGYGVNAPWMAGQSLSLSAEAALIAPLLDAQPAPVHLVGHSYGAAVAVQLALRNPDLIASLSLYEPTLFSVPLAEPARPSEVDEVLSLSHDLVRILERGDNLGAARRFVSYWAGAAAWERLSDEQQARLARRAHKAPSDFDALIHAGIDGRALSTLTMPVLCMRGSDTRLSALRVARCFGQYVPNVESVSLPGMGHMGPMTHALAVNRIIKRFIDQHRRYDSMPRVRRSSRPINQPLSLRAASAQGL
jgi:pimeloyl-ACP methyl ester carboxylesterase